MTSTSTKKAPSLTAIARKHNVEASEFRLGDNLEIEVTSRGAGLILDMKPSSVRRRHYKGDIEGQVSGRDLWLSYASVMKYMDERRPAGRPIETGAGVGRKRPSRAEREASASRNGATATAAVKVRRPASKKRGRA